MISFTETGAQKVQEFLDATDRIPHDIDVGAQVPHGAVRAYVMGETDGMPKSAAWAAPICDVGADMIAALARRMAASGSKLPGSRSSRMNSLTSASSIRMPFRSRGSAS